MTPDPIPPTLLAASEPMPEPKSDPASIGPGLAIRRARERAGLSVEDFAAQLKLAKPTLEALERDDFEALNEPVYVRGYYRKCAKALSLPEAELMAAYERLVGPKAPPAPTKLLIGSNPALSRARIGRDGESAGLGRSFGAIAVAVLIGGGAWYFSHDSNGGTRSSAAPAAVPVPVPYVTPVAPPAAQPELPASTGATPAEPAAAPATSAAPAAVAPVAAAPATGATAPAAAPVGPAPAIAAPPAPEVGGTAGASLILNFKATSWVRVEDADSRVLLSGVIQSGDRQTLHGKPPYSLFVGNGPGVIVEYGGKAIDLAPYIKQNQTARLSVP